MAARKRIEVSTGTYTGKFAVHLRQLREKKGMTIDQVSEATGIPTRTLYAWESATNEPKIGQLPVLANALGVKLSKLLPEM